jgi:hypothetical protein
VAESVGRAAAVPVRTQRDEVGVGEDFGERGEVRGRGRRGDARVRNGCKVHVRVQNHGPWMEPSSLSMSRMSEGRSARKIVSLNQQLMDCI